MDETDRLALARQHLDSAESWLRRLVRHALSSAYDQNYFNAQRQDGTNVINAGIRQRAHGRIASEPSRFPDEVAAIDFGDAISIVSNPELSSHFQQALMQAYPDGPDEARTFLRRLEAHRNRIAHGGTCSVRALEQCICYSNDLIESVKKYFLENNLERRFNVPTFTRLVDSLGNERNFTGPEAHERHVDMRSGAYGHLYSGDTLIVEVDVDESFDGYTIRWFTFSTPSDRGEGKRIELPIQLKHVGEQLILCIQVISNEQWHRLEGQYDDRIDLRYRVLPPG
jgi:hypothetical protein